jgi:glycosyltransferase involved in cell wall biosynthesis
MILRHFYCPSMPIGGAERQAVKLAERLQENGVSVMVVTGLWDWGQPRQEVIQGIPVRRHFTAWGMFDLKGLRRFGQYFYLLSLFLFLIRHRNEYDVIHCHSAMFEAPIAVQAAKLLRKLVVVRAMASGTWGDLKRLKEDRTVFGTGWMTRKIRDAAAVIALNKQVVQELVEIGVAQDKIFRIPNGVEIRSDSRTRDYALDDSVVVTFVGRLHPQKGVNMLLRAFWLTLQEMPNIHWQLKLAGTGWLERNLKALADELAISQQVEFLGHVEDVDALLDQSDLFVLPSVSEGMSNALLEAMAHGLPCIVRDIPGNNDVIQDGENGVTVKSDDVEGLARAMIHLAADVELRKRLGQQAYQTVKTHYSLAKVTHQYIRLYENLLHPQPDS